MLKIDISINTLTPKLETICSAETWTAIYQITYHHTPEDGNLN